MEPETEPVEACEGLQAGDHHYKAFVGPPENYDVAGAMQFNLLTSYGLRQSHKLLDISRGSLRVGKLLIAFLQPGHYFGIEPNRWVLEEGIEHELGRDLIAIKKPVFDHSEDFELGAFGSSFDYMVAQSIFSHTSASQIRTCLKSVPAVLKPRGLFLATFVLGKENYQGEEWVYPGCVRYTHEFIAQMVGEQGLRCLKTHWAHPANQTWYVIFHPENEASVRKLDRNAFRRNKVSAVSNWVRWIAEQPLLNNPLTRGLYHLMGKPGTGAD
jgi:hypothetical protein